MDFEALKAALPAEPLLELGEFGYPKVNSGKVCEVFRVGEHYLMVATDRLSAFDVVLPFGLAGKGMLLTQLSLWWMRSAGGLTRHHLAENHDAALRDALRDHPEFLPRASLVKPLKPLGVELIVRGYLCGSAWRAYAQSGACFGHKLPEGLKPNAKLASPWVHFTTKAAPGQKDAPLSLEDARGQLGEARVQELESTALKLYRFAARKAEIAGILLMDAKLEFGLNAAGQLCLMDEIFTSDSARFCQSNDTASFMDKEYLREQLQRAGWSGEGAAPTLSPEVLKEARARHLQLVENFLRPPH